MARPTRLIVLGAQTNVCPFGGAFLIAEYLAPNSPRTTM